MKEWLFRLPIEVYTNHIRRNGIFCKTWSVNSGSTGSFLSPPVATVEHPEE